MQDVTMLHNMLSAGVVRVRFVKRDGTVREMRATTNTAMFSYDYKGTVAKRSSDITTMWDLDKGAWRSMRNDTVLGYIGVAA